jgi:hypothetical protein
MARVPDTEETADVELRRRMIRLTEKKYNSTCPRMRRTF